jgi:hypothetical protein
MAIFKIVDKSGIWGCGCSGRMGVVIVEENLVGEGERCDGVEFWWQRGVIFGVYEVRFGVNLRRD